jgi:phosphinothricin acetyltransferase
MAASLRLARETDAPGVLAIYAPIVERTAVSFELEPPPLEEMARRITRGATWPFLVCVDGASLLGYAYAFAFRERPAYRFTVESTVYVAEGARRRGVARALYGSLIACLELQGFARVIAGITLPNAASVALHEAFGFRPCAHLERVGFKLGAWHDVGYWALPLRLGRDGGAPPGEPRPIADLVSESSRSALEAAIRTGAPALSC